MANPIHKTTPEDLKWVGVRPSGTARTAITAIEDRNKNMKKALDEALGEDQQSQEDHACYDGECANRKKERE